MTRPDNAPETPLPKLTTWDSIDLGCWAGIGLTVAAAFVWALLFHPYELIIAAIPIAWTIAFAVALDSNRLGLTLALFAIPGLIVCLA